MYYNTCKEQVQIKAQEGSIIMAKVRHNSETVNVMVNVSYYMNFQLEEMLSEGIVFKLSDVLKEQGWNEEIEYFKDFRLSLEYAERLEVVYDKNIDSYTNIAILKDGRKIYIEL